MSLDAHPEETGESPTTSLTMRPQETGESRSTSSTMGPLETGASRSTSPTLRSTWRASRLGVLLGVIIVAAAVFSVIIGAGPDTSRRLDPDDASLAGSKALAQLLRARGVTVDRVDSVEAAEAKAAAAKAAGVDRLLLITDTEWFDTARLARIQGDRVIVGDLPGRADLAPVVRPAGSVRVRSRDPRCALPAAVAAGSAYIGGTTFTGPPGATGCYPAADGFALVSYPNAGGTTTLVGDGGFMTDLRLADDGNAALALNLLGAQTGAQTGTGTGRAVTWLVAPDDPPTAPLPGSAGKSIYELMPPSIGWAVLMAVVCVLLVAFWRGRRLGPVVTERLPVVVRAAETVEGRGRLYRARRARERAAYSLRAGTIDRLAPRLGLASGAGRHELVAALAVRTGQDVLEVGGALYGTPPADDAGLVALAGYLELIERKVSEH